jgi:hypothetical protein
VKERIERESLEKESAGGVRHRSQNNGHGEASAGGLGGMSAMRKIAQIELFSFVFLL